MSGALWFFFWDESSWTGAPAPTPSPSPTPTPPPPVPSPMPPPPPPGEGGGHGGKGHGKGHKKEQDGPPVDLWNVREAYLKSLFPPIPPAPGPEAYESEANRLYEERQAKLEAANAERSSIIMSLRNASSISQMKAYGVRIKELNATIQSLEGQQSFRRFMKR